MDFICSMLVGGETGAAERAFLKLLRKTGNVRLVCRELGLKYGTMQHRRSKHRAFALRWFSQAKFDTKGRAGPQAKRGSAAPFRTLGGEMVVCRRNDGKLQMRRAQPGKLTREAEQAFLAALSATCNIRLAAAAVGAAFNAFDRRRRQDPAFEREMRTALARGYEALEMALVEGMAAARLPTHFGEQQHKRKGPPKRP